MEQTVVSAPGLQILDVPVPQMVEQLLEVFKAVGHRGARAGHRSAQGLSRLHPGAAWVDCDFRHPADGGTVGGSADSCVLFFVVAADCGADR